jgi:hypothetical protein
MQRQSRQSKESGRRTRSQGHSRASGREAAEAVCRGQSGATPTHFGRYRDPAMGPLPRFALGRSASLSADRLHSSCPEQETRAEQTVELTTVELTTC